MLYPLSYGGPGAVPRLAGASLRAGNTRTGKIVGEGKAEPMRNGYRVCPESGDHPTPGPGTAAGQEVELAA